MRDGALRFDALSSVFKLVPCEKTSIVLVMYCSYVNSIKRVKLGVFSMFYVRFTYSQAHWRRSPSVTRRVLMETVFPTLPTKYKCTAASK